jgi:hypothetical protein
VRDRRHPVGTDAPQLERQVDPGVAGDDPPSLAGEVEMLLGGLDELLAGLPRVRPIPQVEHRVAGDLGAGLLPFVAAAAVGGLAVQPPVDLAGRLSEAMHDREQGPDGAVCAHLRLGGVRMEQRHPQRAAADGHGAWLRTSSFSVDLIRPPSARE